MSSEHRLHPASVLFTILKQFRAAAVPLLLLLVGMGTREDSWEVWALVFIATRTSGEVHARLGGDDEEMLTVFLAPTPNPTAGFLMFVKASEVVHLDMSVEDAAKLVISCGLVTPEYRARTAALAATAARRGERTPEPVSPP